MSSEDLFSWWWREYGRRRRSPDIDKVARKRLLPTLGGLPLSDVTPAPFEGLLVAKTDVLAPRSLNHLPGLVHTVFARAIKRDLWSGTNPAALVERRKVPNRADRCSRHRISLRLHRESLLGALGTPKRSHRGANGRIFPLKPADPRPSPSLWARLRPFSARLAEGSIPGASTLNPAATRGFSLRCTKGAGNATRGVLATGRIHCGSAWYTWYAPRRPFAAVFDRFRPVGRRHARR
jgi:hypothetical protein